MPSNKAKITLSRIVALCVIALLVWLLFLKAQNAALKSVIERLSADSRVAEAVITEIKKDTATKKTYTTIKFVEYDTKMQPLPARYFTFPSDIIHFQAMVIRFGDFYVRKGDSLRGKSACLFMKAFCFEGDKVKSYEINKVAEVPSGYRVWKGPLSLFEKNLWRRFWDYALDPKFARRDGVKNAQLEAPGTKFVPWMIYTIKIEHDGGVRIDAAPVPGILKNEN